MNSTSPSLDAFDVCTTDKNDTADLRVVFYNAQFIFTRSPPDQRFEDLRTFSYDKLVTYCGLVSDGLSKTTENAAVHIPLHHTPTMDNPTWKMTCWWELDLKAGYRPLLDEPFRELLTLLEKTHDEMTSDPCATTFGALKLPQVQGITHDVPIFKLARLYWSAKHLRLQQPLRWESELRSLLLRAINVIDTNAEYPAFRGVDFWYIWGAFRGLDEEIVDAMVVKMIDACDHKTQPNELKLLLVEGHEVTQRMEKIKQKRGTRSWAEQVRGGIGERREYAPPKLVLPKTNGGSWRSGPNNAAVAADTISSRTDSFGSFKAPKSSGPSRSPDNSPQSAEPVPITILRKDSITSTMFQKPAEEDTAKKEKGTSHTPPSGMAPPPLLAKGSARGNKKISPWGSKRGKNAGRRGSVEGGDLEGANTRVEEGEKAQKGLPEWGWQK